MLEKIKKFLPDFCANKENITEETTLFGDLGLASIDFLMFLTDINNEFNININENDAKQMFTMGDVIKCIESKL